MKPHTHDSTYSKGSGRIYTPEAIVRVILDLSGYDGARVLQKHVMENSCGDGAFLCEIVSRYCRAAAREGLSAEALGHDLSVYIHGIELDGSERDKCVARLDAIAAGYGARGVRWDVRTGDTLTIHAYDGKMDYVLGNPPYVRVHNLSAPLESIKKFAFAQNGMTDLFIVFYEIGLRMLREGGVLGYITPSSFFSSVAGARMRKALISRAWLRKIVDLKHYQPFPSTTYTAIVILQKSPGDGSVASYRFDEQALRPCRAETLTPADFCLGERFYFAEKRELAALKDLYANREKCDIQVKNGYATLCDQAYVGDFAYQSPLIIPVVKASKGIAQRIIYPYDQNARLLPEAALQKDAAVYAHLLSYKERLEKRSNERDAQTYWYAYGRSQALNDTYTDKLALNTLIRDERDLKLTPAPAGVGVYGGLYIVSPTIARKDILAALNSKAFAAFVALLGRYKSGGYYTFSSKDVKMYLDYRFSRNGGTT